MKNDSNLQISPSVRTPFVNVDWKKATRNAQFMLEKCEQLGVRLRPHVKTHKTVELAYLQCGNKIGPITVSTMAELFFFHQNGFNDILYAVPITSIKLEELKEIVQTGSRIHICFDSLFMAEKVVETTKNWQVKPLIYLEVDPGYGRCGFDISSNQFETAVRLLNENNLTISAVMAHSGHSYAGATKIEIDEIASVESHILNQAADLVQDLVGSRPKTSAGSTPTSVLSDAWQSVDEVRPGNYVMFDVFMHDLGVCDLDAIACSVTSSVIGIYPERNEVVIDAGALALSKDIGHPKRNGEFGICVDHPNLKLIKLSQEHGTLKSTNNTLPPLQIGETASILPNHSCLTLACYSNYNILGSTEFSSIRPCREW